ncbi:hypothetical protein Y032_0210g2155 [Ancylostoma ceylanicum]|nr:hypothetical protein Y032_0210g2155 [Ancylostoma ceylanicum]
MGWLTPLTLKEEQFFQHLWTQQYDWDTLLSEKDVEKRKQDQSETRNFSIDIPRKTAEKKTRGHHLVIFADASTTAMYMVAYLTLKGDSNLLMAESKLPKVDAEHTVPKLEMNAVWQQG